MNMMPGSSRAHLPGCVHTRSIRSTSSHVLCIAKVLQAGTHDRMPLHERGSMEGIEAALMLLLQFLKSQFALKGVGE